MRISKAVVLIFAILSLAGCSSVTVNHDFDSQADFGSYSTYAWIERPVTAIGDADAAKRMNTLLDKRIKSSVEAQLAARGMTPAAESPDVLLLYHTGIDRKIDVETWGYAYPHYPYGGWQGSQVDVYDYNEGTLIVDIIDAGTRQLVWRGTATQILDETASPEERDENLDMVMEQLFANYPPK